MGAAARQYAAREHDLDHVADAYVAALEEAAAGEVVMDAVLRELAVAAGDVGINQFDPALAELAA